MSQLRLRQQDKCEEVWREDIRKTPHPFNLLIKCELSVFVINNWGVFWNISSLRHCCILDKVKITFDYEQLCLCIIIECGCTVVAVVDQEAMMGWIGWLCEFLIFAKVASSLHICNENCKQRRLRCLWKWVLVVSQLWHLKSVNHPPSKFSQPIKYKVVIS